jgi:hypothetical protein
MVHHLSVLRVAFVLIFASASWLPLTQAQTSQGEEPPQFSVSFRTMGWSSAIKELYIMQGETKKPFTATDANPSKRIDYRGPSPLLIYKEGETELNQDGVPIPRLVGRFAITNSGDWLLVLEESSDSSGRLMYDVFSVVDAPDEIEAGYRVVNFTGAPLAIRMNDSRSLIEPADFMHLSPNAREDFSLSVLIAAESENGWEVQYENLFRDRPGIRTTLFVFKKQDRIRTRRFLDRATADGS